MTDSLTQKIDEIKVENVDSALYQLEQEIAYSAVSDTSCLIDIYKYYAKVNGRKSNYFLVFTALWKALLLADQAELKKEKFLINMDIGRFYGYLKRYEKAKEHFKLGSILKKQLYESNEMTDGMAIDFYFYQMSMNKNKDDYKTAQIYLDSCYQHVDRENLTGKYYFLEFERAHLLAHNHQYEAALEIYHEAIDSIKESHPGYQVIMYTHVGDAYFGLSQQEKGLEAYAYALEVIEKYKAHYDFLPELYERLANINYALGNFEKAYLMREKEEAFRFKFFDSRSKLNSYLLNVQDDFRIYKKEEEQRNSQLKLIQLQQKQKILTFQRIMLVGTLFFLSMLAFAFLKFQKGKINSEKAINNHLQQKNLEKEELLQHIEKKNEELMTLSNIMSHDLKAPLRNISSFSGLIKRQVNNGFDKEQVLSHLSFITNSTESMSTLIEDLLLFSKINIEKPKFCNVNLNDLAHLVLSAFSYDINSGIAVINIKELPTIKGNPGLLKTVFHNIISNAIKYQPKDQPDHQPTVNIWCEEAEEHYCIFVEDNGIGINLDYADKLFQPFVRFHSVSEYKGTGLGMSICDRVMKTHNGSIELDHTSPAGSRFKLVFIKDDNIEKETAGAAAFRAAEEVL